MDGKTYPYLELTALPVVGEAILLPQAAFVISADGARLIWANAAGLTLFGARSMNELLALRLSDFNPLKAQMARLSRLLPSETGRFEMLRAGSGAALSIFPAICRRLNLADGERAVLAIAAGGSSDGSLTARAEKLVDAIGARDCLAAVLSADGKAIAGSGGFDELVPAEPLIDALVADAQAAPGRMVKRTIGARPAGAARFRADGRDYILLIVGPPAEAPPVDAVAGDASLAVPETPIEVMLPDTGADAQADSEAPVDRPTPEVADVADEVAIDLAPVVRFAWATDEELRFTMVSSELAAAVGANGALVGHELKKVIAVLALDPDGIIDTALAARAGFATTIFWPTEGGDAVEIAFTGHPVAASRSRVPREFSGYRGFGTIHADVRQPDTREDTAPLPALKPEEASEPLETAVPPENIALPESPAPEEAAPTPEMITASADLDAVAPTNVGDAERGISWAPVRVADAPETPTADDAPPIEDAAASAPSNIVHLPGVQNPSRIPPERLSGTERDAFRRIAEALGTRRAAMREEDSDESEAARFARREAARVPAADIDTRVLDRLPIGLVIFRDRRTLFANRTLLELLGYATFDAFLAAGGAEAIFPGGDEIANHVAEAGGKLAAVRRDGSPVPVQVWLHAITFGSSTALMLSLNPDRGENLDDEVEIELTRLEDRAGELEAILDTATDGVIVFDGRGKIERLNRAAEALFGVNSDEYVRRYFTDLLADESQKTALDYLDGLAANGVASVLNDGREVIGRVPQGGLIPLFMTMGRIAGSDKFCAVLRDITHWKNIEAELTAARRSAETANAQKSDFLAKISHEIRTPLNAIIGFSEVMMSERFGPIGNDRYRDYLHDINVSGAHLMSLINDLLDLSKIEAGKLDLAFEAVPVNALIQECVALMQPQANRERILIRTSLSSDVPNVVADQRSFRQILLNLMSNAIKFTRAGGQVIVSSTLEANGEVTVRIRDTGIGMSEKDIETALKPFRQVALSRGDREHGTGLGLPLTKAMVEANRATFAIDSAPDQGTLVKITFPTTRVLAG